MENKTGEVYKLFNILLDSKDNELWQVDPSKIINRNIYNENVEASTIELLPMNSSYIYLDNADERNQLNVDSSENDPFFIKRENADRILADLANENNGMINRTLKSELNQKVEETMPRKFPYTLWKLANEGNDDAICWTATGDTFIINEPLLESKYLESNRFFKTKKIKSFIRQLNLYGFRKLTRKRYEERNEYRHRFFKRGQPELIQFIKRKVT